MSTPPNFKNEQAIVIGIPVQWKNQEALVKAINSIKGYSYAGMALLNEKTQDSFETNFI